MNNSDGIELPEGRELQFPDDEGGGRSKSTASSVKLNYLSRFLEISRFSGAPAQGAYYYSRLSTTNSSEQLAASIQIGNVIGNGTGLICGLVLHLLSHNHYRTGSHELHWVDASEPIDIAIARLGIKSDAAYIRQGDTLHYFNRIIKKHSILVEQKDFEYDFESFFDEMEEGSSKVLSSKDLKHLSAKIRNHEPVSGKTATNPLYRKFKTLANFGWQFGAVLSNFLGLQNPSKRKLTACILSDICCLILGSFVILWWLGEKALKIETNTRHQYAVTGREGWSKYTKTALVFGISLGQAMGGFFSSLISHTSAAMVSFRVGFWGGIVGVASFMISLIVVPLVNWYTSRGYKLCLVSDDYEITADTIPNKTVMLKRYKNQLKAYYCKGGKLSYPVDIPLKPEEIEDLEFPAAGEKKFITKADDAALVEKITSHCVLGRLASDDKNYIRNNYTRSGMTLGAGLGACLGLLVGGWYFGPVLGGIIFSALGSVIGGAVFSLKSHKLHRIMHPIPEGYQLYLMADKKEINPDEIPNKGKKVVILKQEDHEVKAYFLKGEEVSAPINLCMTIEEANSLGFPVEGEENKIIHFEDNKKSFEAVYSQVEDLENSWDYVTRSTAGVFGFIGAAVVCLINPAAALLLVPLGSAIASAIGWGVGILIMRKARQISDEEKKAATLPWTQRIIAGANIGNIIGGALGVAIGFAGFIVAGPASIILAVSFFGAVGAVVGAICSALLDKTTRTLIGEGLKKAFRPSSSQGSPRPPSSTVNLSRSLSQPNLSRRGSTTAQILPFVGHEGDDEDKLEDPLDYSNDSAPLLPVSEQNVENLADVRSASPSILDGSFFRPAEKPKAQQHQLPRSSSLPASCATHQGP